MRMEIVCTECGGYSVQVVHGKRVCVKCGVELKEENNLLGGRKWNRDVTTRNLNRIRRFTFILNGLSDMLGLTEDQVSEVKKFMVNILQQVGKDYKPDDHLFVTYSIWHVLRSEGVPISLNELLGLTNQMFRKRYRFRHVIRLLKRMYGFDVAIQHHARLTSEEYIDFVINRLYHEKPNIDYHDIASIREKAKYIIKLLNRGYPIANPRVAAGVSISIALSSSKSIKKIESIERMIEYVAELLRVSPHTLRRRVREVMKNVGLIKKSFTV